MIPLYDKLLMIVGTLNTFTTSILNNRLAIGKISLKRLKIKTLSNRENINV